MRAGRRIAVIIPARDEAAAIGHVLAAVPCWVDQTVVVDNGSRDGTAAVARKLDAEAVYEPRPGYGAACLAGMAALAGPDIVVFLDGDFSDYPEDMVLLVDPLLDGDTDLVLGTRMTDPRSCAALTIPQRFGNKFACLLMRLLWGAAYTDLGRFRAIRRTSLQRLAMCDRNYGWTVEMQIKALRQGLAVREVPMRYRQRIGVSKISGTVLGVLGAGSKIIWVILSHSFRIHGT